MKTDWRNSKANIILVIYNEITKFRGGKRP
jgi:hypothetical protein